MYVLVSRHPLGTRHLNPLSTRLHVWETKGHTEVGILSSGQGVRRLQMCIPRG